MRLNNGHLTFIMWRREWKIVSLLPAHGFSLAAKGSKDRESVKNKRRKE